MDKGKYNASYQDAFKTYTKLRSNADFKFTQTKPKGGVVIRPLVVKAMETQYQLEQKGLYDAAGADLAGVKRFDALAFNYLNVRERQYAESSYADYQAYKAALTGPKPVPTLEATVVPVPEPVEPKAE